MKLQFITACFLCASFAYASIASIACPSANTLQFTALGSNLYEVSGMSEVLAGNLPAVLMVGTAQSKDPEKFISDTYQRANGRSFICRYASLSLNNQRNNQRQIIEIKAIDTQWLQWCTIDGGQNNHCEKDRLSCALHCEILAGFNSFHRY